MVGHIINDLFIICLDESNASYTEPVSFRLKSVRSTGREIGNQNFNLKNVCKINLI